MKTKCVNFTFFQGKSLPQSLTQEMTSGEMKFHLECEALLTTVAQPDFRQLVVEAILVLILIVENNVVPYLGGMIVVENIVNTANTIFLEDQAKMKPERHQLCSVEKVGSYQMYLIDMNYFDRYKRFKNMFTNIFYIKN